MSDSNGQFDDLAGEKLGRLPAGLRGLYAPPRGVPAELDRVIVSAGRAAMAGRRRWRLVMRWGVGAAAAAAIIVVAIHLMPGSPAPQSPAGQQAKQTGEDLNHDGKVDMLDAYLLARRVELKEKMGRELDLNQDGVVDRKDADVIALEAVKLKPEGVQ
jgi:hypothetical protein